MAETLKDPKKRARAALRVAHNNLARRHGFEPAMLDEIVSLLELVVRAHALRIIGCPDEVVWWVLKDSRA